MKLPAPFQTRRATSELALPKTDPARRAESPHHAARRRNVHGPASGRSDRPAICELRARRRADKQASSQTSHSLRSFDGMWVPISHNADRKKDDGRLAKVDVDANEPGAYARWCRRARLPPVRGIISITHEIVSSVLVGSGGTLALPSTTIGCGRHETCVLCAMVREQSRPRVSSGRLDLVDELCAAWRG